MVETPSGTMIPWRDFLFRNRSWLGTEEVSVETASGKRPMLESIATGITRRDTIVVAVHQGGAISVDRPTPPAVMKYLIASILCAAFWTSLAVAGASDSVAIVRQHQQGTNVTWDMPVDLVGEGLSALNVEEGGSLFQLWTIHQPTLDDFLLDQKLVGAYLPKAELSITTEDPYPNAVRTRADRPFQLHVTVSGLLSGPNVPLASTKVLLEHYAAGYPESLSLTRDEAVSGTPVNSLYIDANGTFPIEFPVASLSGPDPTKVAGEEHFLVHALPDGDVAQTQIAATSVQIWPVAEGRISGIENGAQVGTSPPVLTVDLEDLYPRSDTWLQIYQGSPALGTVGTKLSGSVLVLDQDVPASRVLQVGDWASALTDDGLHTIELLTETPFGIDRLDYVTIGVNRVLEVRAMIGDMEYTATAAE